MEVPTTEEASGRRHDAPAKTAERADTEDDSVTLARRLVDKLTRAGPHRHEVRLALALMFDVVELLETERPPR
jgi:hypothetical protein